MAKEKSEKPKNLEELKKQMNEKYGKGTVVGGIDKTKEYDSVSTGSISFDDITNCNGIPTGKLIEIYGPESSGKSTLMLHTIAEWQQKGKKCMLSDYEYSFDSDYAKTIGVNIDDLIISQPNNMEDGYNLIYDYIVSGLINLVVIDSHTAMVSKMRLQGEIGDAKMAPEARVNSDALRKIKPVLEPNNVTLIGVSQLRANIGCFLLDTEVILEN
jgi:recombination protein RecA